MDEEIITIKYYFKFSDGKSKTFTIDLDAETLNFIGKPKKSLPKWAELNYHQCPNCPLKPETSPHCPIAVNMVDMVEFFKDLLSYEQVTVYIESESRSYAKKTALQEAFSSLMGIPMATSGCPVMGKLKPMVRTHLPFATSEETTYRILSMYLLSQYFVAQNGKTPDWDLNKLKALFEDIQQVNKHFWKRLAAVATKDVSLNALVRLDNQAQFAAIFINEAMLFQTELLFDAYLNE